MAVRTSKPRQGPIASIGMPPRGAARRRALERIQQRRRRDGTYRPNVLFAQHTGVMIVMRAEPGLTRPGLLRSPFRFQAPVTDDLTRRFRHSWTQWKAISGGPRLRDDDRELFELPITTMFMDDIAQDSSRGIVAYPYAPFPQLLVDELIRIMGGRRGPGRDRATPFRLTLSQPQVFDEPLVNMIAVLTDLEAKLPAGEIGVERISATFLEYPETQVDRRRQPRADEQRRIERLEDADPTVQGGGRGRDSLHAIATRYYGQASLWPVIAKANGIKGVSPHDPDELARWAVRNHKRSLVIPPRPAAIRGWSGARGGVGGGL